MTFVELTEHKHAQTVGKDASSLLGTVRCSISRLADPARGGGGGVGAGRDTIFPSPTASCLRVGTLADSHPSSGIPWTLLKVLLPILSPGCHREWDRGITSRSRNTENGPLPSLHSHTIRASHRSSLTLSLHTYAMAVRSPC